MKCNNCYYAKTNNCRTKGISFFGNDCEKFVNIYIADALINQGIADERERICDIIKDELESGYLMEKLLREIHSND